MTLALPSREHIAARRYNVPAWVAALALVGTFALARVLGSAEEPDLPSDPRRSGKRISAAASAAAASTATVPGSGWPFWKHVLYRTYEEINNDRLLALAAGVVFYALLALFPAITALVSCYALFADPATIGDHLATLKSIMPQGAYGIVQEQIDRIIANGTGGLSLAFFASLALAIWSANAGMKAIIDALNVVYEVKEWRSFIKLNLVSLAMTVCAIIGLLLAIGAVVVVPIVLSYLPLGGFGAEVIAWLRWPAVVVLLMLGLAALYRFGPNRDEPRWRWFGLGNVFAALAWLAGSVLLSWYLSNFANYGATYGSLGAVIGLMMWLWVTAVVVLVGAELNSEIEAARAPVRKPPQDQIGGR